MDSDYFAMGTHTHTGVQVMWSDCNFIQLAVSLSSKLISLPWILHAQDATSEN